MRRRSISFFGLAIYLLWSASVHAQIRVVAPHSLAKQFPSTHGMIYGTTATFGAPYYGDRVLGTLRYGKSRGQNHCSADDYQIVVPEKNVIESEASHNVILVRRGSCTFVTKVKVAEDKKADAVIVVDSAHSTLSAEDVQRIVMADDGYGDNVRIPSVLISRSEGEKLIDAVEQGTVLVELAWDIPRGEVVIADLWMSSASKETNEFLLRFKDSAEYLRYHVQFVPHYHVFSLPSGTDFGDLCIDTASRFCAPDPDGPGPITGAHVADEDARQLCIWNVTARTAEAGDVRGATFSQEWWDYVTTFWQTCLLKADDDAHRFGKTCSHIVMKQLRLPVHEVDTCVARWGNEFLEEQIRNVAWSPQALRLNGWRYSGPLDPETVLKAICSGYATPLQECEQLMELSSQGMVIWLPAVTLSTFFWAMAGLVAVLALLFLFYRRELTKNVRTALREEVMLEVQTQMSDYVSFQEAGSASQSERRTLSF